MTDKGPIRAKVNELRARGMSKRQAKREVRGRRVLRRRYGHGRTTGVHP